MKNEFTVSFNSKDLQINSLSYRDRENLGQKPTLGGNVSATNKLKNNVDSMG